MNELSRQSGEKFDPLFKENSSSQQLEQCRVWLKEPILHDGVRELEDLVLSAQLSTTVSTVRRGNHQLASLAGIGSYVRLGARCQHPRARARSPSQACSGEPRAGAWTGRAASANAGTPFSRVCEIKETK